MFNFEYNFEKFLRVAHSKLGLGTYHHTEKNKTPKLPKKGVRIFQKGVRIFQKGVRIFQKGVRIFQKGVRIFRKTASVG